MEFIARIQSAYALSERSALLLASELEAVEFPRKTIVAGEGERLPYAYFVERGSVRNYVWRGDRHVIISFAFEGDAATTIPGTEGGTTARYTIETMEPSTLLRIASDKLEELFAADTALANWGRRMACRTLAMHEKYFTDYYWMEKGEQYVRMIEEYPELLRRIALKDLAAYLSITPQTLSRIRSEIR